MFGLTLTPVRIVANHIGAVRRIHLNGGAGAKAGARNGEEDRDLNWRSRSKRNYSWPPPSSRTTEPTKDLASAEEHEGFIR